MFKNLTKGERAVMRYYKMRFYRILMWVMKAIGGIRLFFIIADVQNQRVEFLPSFIETLSIVSAMLFLLFLIKKIDRILPHIRKDAKLLLRKERGIKQVINNTSKEVINCRERISA